MIARDASTIDHVTPRPPIDLRPTWASPESAGELDDHVALSPEECLRLWRLVKQAAEGTNMPAESAIGIPIAEPVDMSGWWAA